MDNYSYSEIQEMQQKAMQRVNEMKKKAESYVNSDNYYATNSKKDEKDSKPYSKKYETKITNMDPYLPKEKSYPSFKDFFEKETKGNNENDKIKSTESGYIDGNLTGILNEPDKLLLLGLILLLQGEKADNELIMSLMYIMM